MNDTEFEVVATRSGAQAMRSRRYGEVMHPGTGPRVEAEELYITGSQLARRLARGGSAPVVLFDVGLGAGSNAAAAWRLSETRAGGGCPLNIVSFDRSLGGLELALRAEHAPEFGLDDSAGAAARDLLAAGTARGRSTTWRMVLGDLPGTLAAETAAQADVVFWDPFSPRANPELWTVNAFAALHRVCRPGATVHTYSAATATRAAMMLAGFAVGVGPATGTKQHTTVAALRVDDLEHPLDRRWLERFSRSSAPLPADAPADGITRIAAASQFRELR